MSSFLGPQVELFAKSLKKLFGMIELFYILIKVVIIQVNSIVKTHQTINLKCVHLIYVNLTSTQLIVLNIK